MIKSNLFALWLGFRDAISMQSLRIARQEAEIQKRLRKIWILNFVMIIGCVFIFDICTYMLASLIDDRILIFLEYLYYFCLIYPAYLVSLVLNSKWYSRIASAAFEIRSKEILSNQRRFPKQNLSNTQPLTKSLQKLEPLKRASNDLYRIILGIVYLIQISFLGKFPFLGQLFFQISVCWLYSLYSFEYVWAIFDFSQQKRLEYFSKRYIYFIGYGLPMTLISLISKGIFRDITFALFFPLLIINSLWAKPVVVESTLSAPPYLPKQFNPFYISQLWLSALVNRGFLDLYFILQKLRQCCFKRKK